MKKFALFAGAQYEHAGGGANDFIGDHDTLDEAKLAGESWLLKAHKSRLYLWAHIADTEKMEIVRFGSVTRAVLAGVESPEYVSWAFEE